MLDIYVFMYTYMGAGHLPLNPGGLVKNQTAYEYYIIIIVQLWCHCENSSAIFSSQHGRPENMFRRKHHSSLSLQLRTCFQHAFPICTPKQHSQAWSRFVQHHSKNPWSLARWLGLCAIFASSVERRSSCCRHAMAKSTFGPLYSPLCCMGRHWICNICRPLRNMKVVPKSRLGAWGQ